MTNSKKLFMAAVAMSGLIGGMTQAAHFDSIVLLPYINLSKTAVDVVEIALNATKSVSTDEKAFTKNLYNQQKAVLKVTKASLKKEYKIARLNGSATWSEDKQLYKAYKKLVYKNWKKTGLFPAV